MVNATGETVSTWADGFGVWHARVTFPSGYSPANLQANMGRIRAKARRAIRGQIAARQGEQRFTARLDVVVTVVDDMNVAHSILFAEASK